MRERSRSEWRAAAIDIAFFLALMACCTALLWPIYRTPQLILLAAGALVAGTLIAVLGFVYRWPGYLLVALAVAAFLVLGVPLAVPGEAIAGVLPSFDGMRDLVVGSALGWKQLITVDLPVSSYQALLVPAFVLLLTGTVAGLSAVLRARRGELGILAPLLVGIFAIVLGPTTAWYPLVLGLVFLLVSLFWMTWRARHERRRAIALLTSQTGGQPGGRPEGVEPVSSDRRTLLRPALAALVVLALAVGAGVAGARFLAPTGERDVLRQAVERPFDPRDYVSPLVGFRSYWSVDALDAPLFTIAGVPEGGRVRIATLDTYDGVVYNVGDADASNASGFFARVPSRIDRSGEPGERVTVDVTIDGYRGVWLPTVGDVEQLSFEGSRASSLQDAFYVNRVSGTAAVIGGVREGDEYRLDAVVPPPPAADELEGLEPGNGEVPKPQKVPDDVANSVEAYTEGLREPGEKLAAVVAAIRSAGYISHGEVDGAPYSRSGHAADRVTELLTEPLMLGDGEQYATAVALMANEIGFPARVVFGFVPRVGENTITGSDVSAWVEVSTSDHGWVAIDATPPDREIPKQLPDDTRKISRPQVVVPPPPAADESPIEPNRPDPSPEKPKDSGEFWRTVLAVLRVVGVVALVALVLAAPFIIIGAAKLSRRRRRSRAPDQASRITGAWEEVVDTASDYGYDFSRNATRLELASAVGKADVVTLAQGADEVAFAERIPDTAEADDYWRQLDAVRASWAAEYTRWERFKASFTVRSLTRRRAVRSARQGWWRRGWF